MRPHAQRLLPILRLIRQYLAYQIAADKAFARAGLGDEARIVQIDRRQHALHRPARSQPTHERPGVDRFDGHDARAAQIVGEALFRAKITLHAAVLADHKASQLRPPAFHVLGVDAVIADLRVGHRDDLTTVTRIGEDLLVAGHRRVEANFAVDFAIGANRGAGVDGAIFECKFRRSCHAIIIEASHLQRQGPRCAFSSGACSAQLTITAIHVTQTAAPPDPPPAARCSAPPWPPARAHSRCSPRGRSLR